MAIVFTIITFGIYGIYWFVCLTNDSNRMNSAEATASGGMAVLFTIITFGIYSFYWGNINSGKKVGDSGALYLVLNLFGLGIVNYALAQSKINAAA